MNTPPQCYLIIHFANIMSLQDVIYIYIYIYIFNNVIFKAVRRPYQSRICRNRSSQCQGTDKSLA